MNPSDTIDDLEIARAEALGTLLGQIDALLTWSDAGYEVSADRMETLRELREAYDKAEKAYLDARLAVQS